MTTPTILVVEDNEKNMKLVRALLVMAGWHVLESPNAEQGIEMAKANLPDLILMDIRLPGMDGLSATRQIKADPGMKDIPVVALTAHAMSGDQNRARESGCDGYLSKPIDTRTFEDQIRQYLSQTPEPGPAAPHPGSPSPSFRGAKILIVDDNPVNIKLVTGILSQSGYRLFSAASGEEALEMMDSLLPDLILLDIMMPGIDGYEVTRRVRKDPRFETIPIILITALSNHEDRLKGKNAGAEEFLTKPVNPIEVEARVMSMLKLKRYRDQLDLRAMSRDQLYDAREPLEASPDPESIGGNILLIEDNEKDRKLMQSNLAPLGLNVECITGGARAMARMQEGDIDLAMVDILMPEMDGFEILRRIKSDERMKNIQVLLVSSLTDTDNRIRAVETGADDYLIKPYDQRELHARVKALIKKKRYLDQLHNQYETALSSAMTDGLTRLYNHIYFKKFLGLELLRSQRQNHHTSLLMIDIDDFKQVNDTLGHSAGDEILQRFGALLKQTIREIDVAARYGGEEFAVVLPYGDRQALWEVGQRICQAACTMEIPQAWQDAIGKVSVSIGGAVFPDDADGLDSLVETADFMLYRAKKSGKNQVCVKQ